MKPKLPPEDALCAMATEYAPKVKLGRIRNIVFDLTGDGHLADLVMVRVQTQRAQTEQGAS